MKSSKHEAHSRALQIPRLTRWIILAFGTFHGLMLIISIAPIYKAPHSSLLPALAPYHELTGTSQDWSLFHTIPTTHSLSSKMTIKYPDGRVEEKGPILPGMLSSSTEEHLRYSYMIERVVHAKRFEAYGKGWSDEVAELVKNSGGESFEIEIVTEATRHLFHIQKDGVYFKKLYNRFGTHGASSENY